MSKQDVQERLKNNYIERIRQHVAGMEKQGYILAEDDINGIFLWHFNLNRFKYEVVSSLSDANKHIALETIPNPFKIVLNRDEVIEIIGTTLKIVSDQYLYAYEQYEENIQNVIPEKEMQADLKSYLKLSEKLAGSVEKGMQDTPQIQAQILAGANVFYTGRDNTLRINECNKYYKWNKRADKFELMTADTIGRIIADVTGIQHKNLEIETNMRTVYPVTVTNTSFPVIWNRQKDLQDKLKRDKKLHDKIAKIVAKYE